MTPKEFETHLVEIRPLLLNMARSFQHDQELADDLVSEATYKALKNRDKFSHNSIDELRSWMYIIIRNLHYSRHRKSKRLVYCDYQPEQFAADDAEMSSHYNQVMSIVSTMSEPHKVLIVGLMLGKTYEELAEEHQTKLGTIKSRIARMRRKLQSKIEGVQ